MTVEWLLMNELCEENNKKKHLIFTVAVVLYLFR